jgi:hypothetical protein
MQGCDKSQLWLSEAVRLVSISSEGQVSGAKCWVLLSDVPAKL